MRLVDCGSSEWLLEERVGSAVCFLCSTGPCILMVEIRYFSVNSDGIRELTCKVKGLLSHSTFDTVSDSARLVPHPQPHAAG